MNEQTINDIERFWNYIKPCAVPLIFLDNFDNDLKVMRRLFQEKLVMLKGFNRETLVEIPSFTPDADFEPLDFVIYFWDISDTVRNMKEIPKSRFEFSKPIILKG